MDRNRISRSRRLGAGMCGAAVLSASLLALTHAAHAENYELRKEPSTSVCHVQSETSRPKLGDLLKTHPTRKAACEDAASRYDKDASDQSKCWTYGAGTVAACNDDDVKLPPK